MSKLGTCALAATCAALLGCTVGMPTVPDTWNPGQPWSHQQGEPRCEGSSGRGVASIVVGGAIAGPASYIGLILLMVKSIEGDDDDLDAALALSAAATAVGIGTIAAGGYGLRNASRCRKAKRTFDCSLAHARLANVFDPEQRRALVVSTPEWCFEPPYGHPVAEPVFGPPAPGARPPLSPPGSTPPTAPAEPVDAEPLPGAGPPS